MLLDFSCITYTIHAILNIIKQVEHSMYICKHSGKLGHSLLDIFQHPHVVDGTMHKPWCEHSGSLSNPPKHKINSILNLIRVLAKIRDSLINNLNRDAR